MADHAQGAHVAHQFDSAEQQKQASMLGMWIFLVTEIMFFGGIFAAYYIYRMQHIGAFTVGSHLLDIQRGTLNTVLLMASSFTMTLAVHAARTGKQKMIVPWIAITIALGTAFLGVKGLEYRDKIGHHLVPGANFQFDPAQAAHFHHMAAQPEEQIPATQHHFEHMVKHVDPKALQLFYSFYFTMTGLHAAHMIIGLLVLVVMLRMAMKGRFTAAYSNPLQVSSLYWHFVDMVWLFLFPTLYLLGRH